MTHNPHLQCYVLIKPSEDEAVQPLQGQDLDWFREMQVSPGTPVTFTKNGRPVDIVSGQIQPSVGSEPAVRYMNFDRDTARLIGARTGTTPVYSD